MRQHPVEFAFIADRMQQEGLPDRFIDHFAHYYDKLRRGETGYIPESDLRPVDSLDDAEQLPPHVADIGRAALKQAVIIKLNGGLGTSMGLSGPKSLLVIKDGLTFLDIIARQAIDVGTPLLLMNSFVTEAASLATLARYPELDHELPLSFVQHKQPKLDDNLRPVTWPDDPDLEWCPPGHGDLYLALALSGTLDRLLAAGYEYAFVSNADNLGAVLDISILGHMVERRLPFLMEVADRTAVDRKGGHLARRADGQLILREIAQCPADDLDAFQDIARHRYFNTNNLWLHLPSLRDTLLARDYQLDLPMIRNRKTVDPRDTSSTPVYQLETAMGSAIAIFPGAAAIRVSRVRLAAVKKTDDLLAVRSDAYVLTDGHRVVLAPERKEPPLVALDETHYRIVTDLDNAFPAGPPSLLACRRVRVEGLFQFGRNISLRGEVTFHNPTANCLLVPDSLVLDGGTWPDDK